MVEVTHQEQQQALDLTFDDTNTTDRLAKRAEIEVSNNRKEPVALIPNVGDAR